MIEHNRCYAADAWEQRKGAEVICVRRDTIANPPKDIVDVELENLIEGGGLQGDLSLRTASTSVFHEHDTLFGRLRPYLRKFWFANTSGVKSGEIWSLYSSTLKPEFLYALTQSAQFLNQALQTAGTKMPRAEWKTIAEAYFAVPQAEEQEKIGILFHKLEQLIAAEKRKLNLLQKKKTTLLRQIFEQKLRFKGYSDFWEQHKLGSLGISYSGLSGKTKTDFGHGLASYITYMNVFQNPIADIDSNGQIEIDAKQHTVRYGDALFTISSETPEEVGMSSVWIGNQKNVYLNSFCFGYRQDGAFDVLYLAYMLRSEAVRNQMRMLAQGISRFNISQHKVMDINVNIPSISEQQKIGSFCRGLDQLISAEVKKIDLLTLKKKALLQQMFV